MGERYTSRISLEIVDVGINSIQCLHVNVSSKPYPAESIYLNFQPRKVVSRYRDPQPHVVENYSYLFNFRLNIYKSWMFYPLSPHDAIRHHFTSLKRDLIFLQPRVLEQKFP